MNCAAHLQKAGHVLARRAHKAKRRKKVDDAGAWAVPRHLALCHQDEVVKLPEDLWRRLCRTDQAAARGGTKVRATRGWGSSDCQKTSGSGRAGREQGEGKKGDTPLSTAARSPSKLIPYRPNQCRVWPACPLLHEARLQQRDASLLLRTAALYPFCPPPSPARLQQRDEHGELEAADEALERCDDGEERRRIQSGGDFVEEQRAAATHNHFCDRHALPLAARHASVGRMCVKTGIFV
eukprot:247593-Chlamydomonas_euryale.AAC.1